MGILYTYGSYVPKDMDIERSTTQVEIFDTGIAMLAGLMIIPAVFAFSGGNPETLQACGTDQCSFSDGDQCFHNHG